MFPTSRDSVWRHFLFNSGTRTYHKLIDGNLRPSSYWQQWGISRIAIVLATLASCFAACKLRSLWRHQASWLWDTPPGNTSMPAWKQVKCGLILQEKINLIHRFPTLYIYTISALLFSMMAGFAVAIVHFLCIAFVGCCEVYNVPLDLVLLFVVLEIPYVFG